MWDTSKIIHKGEYLYVFEPRHPNATKNGYVLMHRAVVENSIGRLLTPNEVVHHKDGNKFNNDISNLKLLDRREHSRMHGESRGRLVATLKCPNCGAIFYKYKNQTHLDNGNLFTCCSPHCRGVLSNKIQHYGITKEIQNALNKNIIVITKV